MLLRKTTLLTGILGVEGREDEDEEGEEDRLVGRAAVEVVGFLPPTTTFFVVVTLLF